MATSKIRRAELTAGAATTGLEAFAALHIALHELDVLALLELGLRSRLTPYDAAYLWLARALDARLVTLDEKLARAWGGPGSTPGRRRPAPSPPPG